METDFDYDPNLVLCGKKAKHTVKMTFAMWDYRLEVTESVSANLLGLDVIEAAIDKIIDKQIEKDDWGQFKLILSRQGGDTLEVDESDDDAETVMRKMLVGFEVVSVVPDGRIFE